MCADAPWKAKILFPENKLTIKIEKGDFISAWLPDLQALYVPHDLPQNKRQELMNEQLFIAANSTVYVVKGDGVIDGMIAAKGSRTLALYAETLEIAHALMKHYIVFNRITQVSFFTRDDVWECKPMSSRCVHRRHTKTVSTNIKWNKLSFIPLASNELNA